MATMDSDFQSDEGLGRLNARFETCSRGPQLFVSNRARTHMKSNFQAILDRIILPSEGGKVDHPKDPGGRTAFGITQVVYDGFRRNRRLPLRDVWLIERAEIVAIYRLQYWDRIAGDKLPAGIDLLVFDGAVNSGPAQSVKWLQAELNVRIDGALGEATLAAVRAHPDHDALVAGVCARRMRFLKALKTWSTFGRGWTRRVDFVRQNAQAIAMGSVGPKVVYETGMEAKARVEDGRVIPGKALADAVTGAGGATTIVSQVTDLLAPVGDAIPAIGNLVVWMTAAGAVVAAAGLLYRRYASAKQREIDEALMVKPTGWIDPVHAPAEATA